MSAYSAIVTAMIARLAFHCVDSPGRLLRGIKFEPAPKKEIDGEQDLPQIRLFDSALSETFVLRGPVNPGLDVKMQVSTSRKAGGTDLVVELMEKALDALETDTDGTIDPIFGGLLDTPFSVKTVAGANEISFFQEARITFSPGTHPLRGDRRRITVLVDAAGHPLIDAGGQYLGPATN